MGLQELLEAEMENKKSIEEEIEEDRRKVEARTPITLNVSPQPQSSADIFECAVSPSVRPEQSCVSARLDGLVSVYRGLLSSVHAYLA